MVAVRTILCADSKYLDEGLRRINLEIRQKDTALHHWSPLHSALKVQREPRWSLVPIHDFPSNANPS